MLKVAIIGSGLIAVKKHIPALLDLHDKLELIAVCDLNGDIAKKVARKFNIKKTYTDFSAMLLEDGPDIVDICTPPQTHAELTIQAIEKGAHVLLEKPMALKISDCNAMIDKAKCYGKKICILHNQIFNPAFMEAKKRILEGEIGDFLGINIFLSTPFDYMTSQKDHWAHRLPGGVLGETGPHGVYLALTFLKNISKVDIHAQKLLHQYPWSKFEDFRIILWGENGMGSITLFYGGNQWRADAEIIGTKGILKVDLEAQTVIKYNRPKLDALSVGLSTLGVASQTLISLISNSLSYILGKRKDAHQIGIKKFVDSVLEDKPSPVTAEEGKEVVRVMEMIIEKLRCVES